MMWIRAFVSGLFCLSGMLSGTAGYGATRPPLAAAPDHKAHAGADAPTPTIPTISRDRLLPQDEFFLDMFMDRYPADGGYRVKRFYGYEFFEPAQERAVEKKRKEFEKTLTDQFRAAGFAATPLPRIEMPLKGVPVKAGGFQNRTGSGFPAHKAYDMNVAEGTPVHPIGRGIVVAREAHWWKKINKGESIRIPDRSWWDTAQVEERPLSLKSGNCVVIYHPPAPGSREPGYYSFYAHMADDLPVEPGQIVGPSDIIGHVEHSGYNAMRQGHGGHLHISVLKDMGQGYLEPVKFGKYLGLREERVKGKKAKVKGRRRT